MSSAPSTTQPAPLSMFSSREAMNSTGQFVPLKPGSDYQAPGFWDALEAAKTNSWWGAKLNRDIDIWTSTEDPNFRINSEQINKDINSLDQGEQKFPEQIKNRLALDLWNSNSKQQYDAILSKYNLITNSNRVISDAGLSGSIGALVEGGLEPQNWLPFVAAGRVAAAYRVGLAADEINAISKIKNAALAGMTAAAVQAPLSAARVADDPYENSWAILHDMAFTGLFGSLEGLSPSNRQLSVMDSLNQLRKDSAKRLEAAAKSGFGGQYAPGFPNAAAQNAMLNESLAPAGARDVVTQPIISKEDLANIPKAAYTQIVGIPIRPDYAATLDSIPSELGRKGVYSLVHDPVPRGTKLAPESYDEWVTRNYDAQSAGNHTTYDAAFKDWAERNNPKAWGDDGIRSSIYESATKAQRRGDLASVDPSVRAMAEHNQQLFDKNLRMMQDMGVPGSDLVTADGTYVPRVWKLGAIQQAIVDHGKPAVEQLLSESMVVQAAKNGVELTAEQAAKRGKFMLQTIIREKQLSGFDQRRFFTIAKPQDIIDKAKEYGIDFTPEEVEQWKGALGEEKQTGATPPRLKFRTDLDETHGMDIPQADGSVKRLNVEDLLENNGLKLADMYSRQALQSSAKAHFLEMVSPEGKKYTGLDQYINDVKKEMIDRNGIMSNDQINKLEKKYIEPLQGIADHVFGQGRGSDKLLDQISSGFRNINTLRTGFWLQSAAIMHLMQGVGENGLSVMASVIPDLGGIFKRAADGTLDNAAAAELESFSGLGTNGVRANGLDIFSDMDGDLVTKSSGFLGKAANVYRKYTGLTSVTDASQKIMGMAFAARMANGSKAFAKKALAELGMTPEMADRIASQIETFKSRATSAVNVDLWSDPEAAAHYKMAMYRTVRRQLQITGPGDQSILSAGNRIVSEPIKKMLMQYHNWAIQAWVKQGMYGFSVRDRAFFQSVAASLLTGSLVLMGRRYATSLGYEGKEREKYLKENMSISSLARGSMANSSYTSLLANAIDSASEMTGNGPVFSSGSRNPSDRNFVTNSLAYSLLFKNIPEAGQGLVDLVRPDKRYTQADWRGLTSLLPAGNALFFNQMLNRIGNHFPKRNKKASRF